MYVRNDCRSQSLIVRYFLRWMNHRYGFEAVENPNAAVNDIF